MIVYKVTNKINNKIYTGATQQTLYGRQNTHQYAALHDSKAPFHLALMKYEFKNFHWEILCDCTDLEELDKMEKQYIKEYRSNDPKYGYNQTDGGVKNFNWNKSVKQNISEKRTGMKFTKEHCKNISKNHVDYSGDKNPMWGKRHTDESKKLMSEALSGANHHFYGKKHSKETKLKMSKWGKGRKFTESHKKAIRDSLKEYWRKKKNDNEK